MAVELTIAGALGSVADDQHAVAGLRAGDERMFTQLFERISPIMTRVARASVDSDAVAEEIVEDTWMAIVTGGLSDSRAAPRSGPGCSRS